MTSKDKAEDKQIVPKTGTDVAIYDPGSDAGAGMEDVGREEYAIPFLYVLDPKSPQCKPVSAGGVPGAKGGMLFNTAMMELFDGEKGAPFIPVHRDHNYGEWIPKNPDGSGGGFVGIRAADDPLVIELKGRHGAFKRLPTSDGHELVETFYLYGLTVTDGLGSPVLLPFKSTGIGAYKNFMTRAMGIQYQGANGMVRPPMWAHLWRVGTAWREPKGQGQSGWYVPKLWLDKGTPLESRLKLTDPLYVQGRELYNSIKAGRVVVKHEDQGGGRQPGEDGEEIPM